MTDIQSSQHGTSATPAAKPERISAVVMALLATGFSVWVLATLPIQAALILTVASVVAWVAWMRTTYAYPVRTRKVIAVYLCAIAFQFIHMSEEYTGGFPHEIVDLFNSSRDWTEKSFLLTFVFGFGAIWVLAAAGALYQLRIANYLLWFYALGAGLINAISHFVFPILKGGYFPGLYTATGHLIMSALLIHLLIKESHRLRTRATGHPDDDSDGVQNALN
ncbi:HXXEE domain-containing protein [Kribbella sp. NPDC058693]|uniref:HXXEE domain-containing protein n=1 Tax=Kribbella sp. NPDC058693 TaxID=3346602 RepID=UPI0036688400